MTDAAARRLVELRRAFDAAFASPPPAPGAAPEYALAIGVGGDRYALRLAQLAGLFKDRRLTLLPGPLPHFLGVAGLDGRAVPVYDLRRMLGYAATGVPRWLVLVNAPEPLAWAFDSFEGQFSLAPEALEAEAAGRARHVLGAVRAGDVLRLLVDVPSLVEAVRSEVGRAQER